MPQLPIVQDGIHGLPPINFYPAADSELSVILQRTPGKKSICKLANCTEIRGAKVFGAYMYFVARRGSSSPMFRVSANGTYSEVGTITTSFTGPVWMEASTDQLLIVDGVSGWVFTPATGHFDQITDPDFPGASTCSAQDGYGLFTQPNSRTWFISELYDFSAFDANQFYVKEAKPDNVLAVKSLLREPWLFGTESIEVWGNVGGSGTSPTFQRQSGGTLEYGCGAAASVQTINNKMIWFSNLRQILLAVAYQPNKISTQLMERKVGTYSSVSDAISFQYTDQNHDYYVVTFPTGNQTWVWDDTTKLWHIRQSWQQAGGWGRDRANCYCLFNNKHYVGDYENGNIYEMSLGYYDELDADSVSHEIRREFYMTPTAGQRDFIYFPDIEIGVKSGVGLISGLDPQIMLQFTEDQGGEGDVTSWSNEVWRSAGKIGERGYKAIWTDMGSGYWRMYRAVFTDPVDWQIQYVAMGS